MKTGVKKEWTDENERKTNESSNTSRMRKKTT